MFCLTNGTDNGNYESGMKEASFNLWDESKIHNTNHQFFFQTRSYAALRAADLDWIVGPGYSSFYILHLQYILD